MISFTPETVKYLKKNPQYKETLLYWTNFISPLALHYIDFPLHTVLLCDSYTVEVIGLSSISNWTKTLRVFITCNWEKCAVLYFTSDSDGKP